MRPALTSSDRFSGPEGGHAARVVHLIGTGGEPARGARRGDVEGLSCRATAAGSLCRAALPGHEHDVVIWRSRPRSLVSCPRKASGAVWLKGFEPMTLSVTQSWEGPASPRHSEVISPELALIDPVLAASARAYLPEPRGRLLCASFLPLRSTVTLRHSRHSRSGSAMDDEFVKPVADGRSWRVLIGVAAVTVLSLLLFDVRVQVGKTPASAETSQEPPSAPSTLVRPPSVPNVSVRTPASARPSRALVASRGRPLLVRLHTTSSSSKARRSHSPRTRLNRSHRAGSLEQAKKTRSLISGEYRWYVWPVISGTRASRAIVQARLVVR